MSHLLWVLSYLWSFVFCWSLVNLNFIFSSSLLCVFFMCFLLYCTFMSWSFLVLLIENRNWFVTLLWWRRILGQCILVGIWGVWMTCVTHCSAFDCIVWCLQTLDVFFFISKHFESRLKDISLSFIIVFHLLKFCLYSKFLGTFVYQLR